MHKHNLLLIIALFIATNTTAMKRPLSELNSSIPPLRLGRESTKKTNILVKYGNQKHIYAKASGRQIKIFNSVSGQKKETLPIQAHAIRHCVNTLNNQIIISTNYDTINIWDVPCNQSLYSLAASSYITNLAVEDWICCSTHLNNKIHVWDLDNGRCIRKGPVETDVSNLMIRNNLIYVGSHDGTIFCVDPQSGKNIYDWQAHKQKISSLAHCKQNDYFFYSGSGDHSIKVWDIRNLSTHSNTMTADNRSHENSAITNILEDKEGKTLFSSDIDTVYEWDVSYIIPQLLSSLPTNSTIKNNCMVIEDNETETVVGTELHVGTEDGIKTIYCDYSFDELIADCDYSFDELIAEITMQFIEKK